MKTKPMTRTRDAQTYTISQSWDVRRRVCRTGHQESNGREGDQSGHPKRQSSRRCLNWSRRSWRQRAFGHIGKRRMRRGGTKSTLTSEWGSSSFLRMWSKVNQKCWQKWCYNWVFKVDEKWGWESKIGNCDVDDRMDKMGRQTLSILIDKII